MNTLGYVVANLNLNLVYDSVIPFQLIIMISTNELFIILATYYNLHWGALSECEDIHGRS